MTVLSPLAASILAATVFSQPLDAAVETAAAPEDLAAVVTASPVAYADLSDDEVFEKAADALQNIKTLRARFTQYSPSGNEMTGTLSLSRPGRLAFEYDAPIPQKIIASGGLLYVHDTELETTDSYPVRQTPLRFLLDKRLDRGAATLDQVIRTEEGAGLLLRPTDDKLSGELMLVFRGPDMALTEWTVFEPSGKVTRVALSDLETGIRLSNRLFRAPESCGFGLEC